VKVPLNPVWNAVRFALVMTGASPSLIPADDSMSGWPFPENAFGAHVPTAAHAEAPVHDNARMEL
jgi:hypothetical protein